MELSKNVLKKTSLNDPWSAFCCSRTYASAQSSIIWYWPKGCGWEGNHRSGVTLAMRHRLSGISTYRLNSLRKGDEHATYAPVKYGTFTFLPLPIKTIKRVCRHCCKTTEMCSETYSMVLISRQQCNVRRLTDTPQHKQICCHRSAANGI